MSFKCFHMTVVGSGRAATGFAIASAILVASSFIVIIVFKRWIFLHCVYPSHNGHKAVLRLASLAAPSASLTQSTNCRWWLFTLLNKDTFNRVNIKPLRGLAEFSPPSPLF